MSSSLQWEPSHRKSHALPSALKFALRRRYQSNGVIDAVFTETDLLYLNGLADANVEGAAALIAAIEKHGDIRVWESF